MITLVDEGDVDRSTVQMLDNLETAKPRTDNHDMVPSGSELPHRFTGDPHVSSAPLLRCEQLEHNGIVDCFGGLKQDHPCITAAPFGPVRVGPVELRLDND